MDTAYNTLTMCRVVKIVANTVSRLVNFLITKKIWWQMKKDEATSLETVVRVSAVFHSVN